MTRQFGLICALGILLGCDAPQSADPRAEQGKEPAAATKKQPSREEEELPPELLDEVQAIVLASSPARYRAFDEQLLKIQTAEKAGKYLNDDERKPFRDAAQAVAAQNELWRSLSVMWARLGQFDKAIHAAQQIQPSSRDLPANITVAPLVLTPGRYEPNNREFWHSTEQQVPRESALSFVAEQQIKRGQLAEARRTLDMLDAGHEKANGQRLMGLSQLFDAYLQRDRLDDALGLAKLFPKYLSRAPQLAAYYADHGRWDDVRQLARGHADEPDELSSLVRVLAGKGHLDQAAEIYRMFLRAKRDHQALFLCAETFVANRNLAEARDAIELIRSPDQLQTETSLNPRLLDLCLGFAKALAAVNADQSRAEFQRTLEYCQEHTRQDDGNIHLIAHIVAAQAVAGDLEGALETAKLARHARKPPAELAERPLPMVDAAHEAIRIAVNILALAGDHAAALKLASPMPDKRVKAAAFEALASRATGDIKTAALEELAAYILAHRIVWPSPDNQILQRMFQQWTPEERLKQLRGATLHFHTMHMLRLLELFKGHELFRRLVVRADEAEEATRRLILTTYIADLLARKEPGEALRVAERLLEPVKDIEELGRSFDGIAETFAEHGYRDQAQRYGQRKLKITGQEVAGGVYWWVKVRAFSQAMQRIESLEAPNEAATELVAFLASWLDFAKDTPLTVEQLDLVAQKAKGLCCVDRAAISLAQAYAIQSRFEAAKELLHGAGNESQYQYGLEAIVRYSIVCRHFPQAVVFLPEIERVATRRELYGQLVGPMVEVDAASVVRFARQQAPEDRARLLLLIADKLVAQRENP